MAIASGGQMGTAADATAGTNSLSITTTTSALVSGDQMVMVVVTDNIAVADGNTNTHLSVGGAGGVGTWTRVGEYTNSPTGVAADGVTVSLWVFNATAAVPIGTTFTITLSGNCTDKCATAHKFTVGAGTKLAAATGFTNPITNEVTGATDFGSAAFSGLSSAERLYFRALGKEANSSTALTNTAGFTVITGIRSRNNAAAVLAKGEFKIATSTGETSNPTYAISGDTAGLFAALIEIPAAGSSPGTFLVDTAQVCDAPDLLLIKSLATLVLNRATVHDGGLQVTLRAFFQAPGVSASPVSYIRHRRWRRFDIRHRRRD